MGSIVRVGMDVHQESIRLAVMAEKVSEVGRGEIVFEKTIANSPEPVRRTFKKLKKTYPKMECCYEASGCGFVLQRELASMKIDCRVVAPSRIPKALSDRVKTDRDLCAVETGNLGPRRRQPRPGVARTQPQISSR